MLIVTQLLGTTGRLGCPIGTSRPCRDLPGATPLVTTSTPSPTASVRAVEISVSPVTRISARMARIAGSTGVSQANRTAGKVEVSPARVMASTVTPSSDRASTATGAGAGMAWSAIGSASPNTEAAISRSVSRMRQSSPIDQLSMR